MWVITQSSQDSAWECLPQMQKERTVGSSIVSKCLKMQSHAYFPSWVALPLMKEGAFHHGSHQAWANWCKVKWENVYLHGTHQIEQEYHQRKAYYPIGRAQSNIIKIGCLMLNAGFWQVKLAKQSALLTTPYWRIWFKWLPFGIKKSFSSKCQRWPASPTIYWSSQLTWKVEQEGITLNLKFSRDKVIWNPAPDKVQAICDMAELTNLAEVRKFLGMIQFNKFSQYTKPFIAEYEKPLGIARHTAKGIYGDQAEFDLALYEPKRSTIDMV